MLGPLARISNQAGRDVMKKFVRNGSHGGIPGENLPFDINNRKRLTFNLFWFIGTGMAAPFLVVLHQLRKNSSIRHFVNCTFYVLYFLRELDILRLNGKKVVLKNRQ